MRLILPCSMIIAWIFHCMMFPIVIEEPISVEQLAMPIIIEGTSLIQEELRPTNAVDEETEEVLQVEEDACINRWNIQLTEAEIDMLAKIIFLEAHTQSEDGISAAIEVVFNRMISDGFPNTLEGVLGQTEPCLQFVTWKFIEKATPTEKEYDMIYAALNGEKEVLTTEYVYFGRGKQNQKDPKQIDDHWFCKE